ncbi:hypothetical protein SAMN05216202_2503 [Pseudomonas mucidolens]|uniref:Uncharacterized protein n=1 Tax=Pseudomonas mucidolens TaxID=46679 RepID=A0A1H2MWT2_9PSED|nr:hypothetical protein SAMN05216202_2503 [Pseudomonas mucidolens]SQH33106.1 Uncharacterised protein [Pseudomonas mucidolens]
MGRTIRRVQTCIRFVQSDLIVPTLCVGMQPGTLCVPKADAERPLRHSHAGAWERLNNGGRRLRGQWRRFRVSDGNSPNCLR